MPPQTPPDTLAADRPTDKKRSTPSLFRRIVRVVLSKTFLAALLALLQIVVFFGLIYWFANIGAMAYGAITVITVLVLVVVLEKDDLNPAYKLMWTLVILLMPIFGAVFYLVWGHRTVPRKKRRLLLEIDARTKATLRQDNAVMDALKQQDDHLAQSAHYLLQNASSPVYPATHTEYYPLGEDFFPRFLDSIKAAEKYIFMQYYIWEEGVMLDATLQVLQEKVAEGVDVRLMWDGFGSLFTLPPGYDKKLRAMGIQVAVFSPLELTTHVSDYAMLNHRDHRKLTVVDGTVAFSGGLNVADEYINVKERFGVWKDTSFMVCGPAVYSMVTTFLHAWDYATATVTNLEDYRLPAPVPPPPLTLENGFVQPYWDSPLDGENVSENAYLNILRHAHNYVYISTPYLILDNEMITNLTLAAKSGVDVRILTPGIPDKPKVFMVTQSYYPVLLRSGVRIFEYTPGFNHAKMYVSDDKVAIIGSANMDYRSLYLHFENCASFYGGIIVGQAKADMEASFAVAHEVSYEETQNISLFRRIAQIVARFFAPLL
ncbi:cardiolipin synthase [Ruminococcaceae bacterium OttesenSCG-928-O06]|nr:cardiolipin synthase [Ruminococcaceae bacterium OttesenSCG-928-O06]